MIASRRIVHRRTRALIALAVIPTAIGFGCSPSSAPSGQAANAETAAYVPGLGEIMTLQQMRYTKLWLAGQASNWDLAAYEIKELQEGFDDVVAFRPTHEDAPGAPRDAVPHMVLEPLEELAAAVDRHDADAFPAAYDALTDACNNCHVAMEFGFNRVRRPATNPYPNQVFAPVAR